MLPCPWGSALADATPGHQGHTSGRSGRWVLPAAAPTAPGLARIPRPAQREGSMSFLNVIFTITIISFLFVFKFTQYFKI